MHYQYLRLDAPSPRQARSEKPTNEICCPDNSNPYPDFEGSTIFEEDGEKENSHVIIIQL